MMYAASQTMVKLTRMKKDSRSMFWDVNESKAVGGLTGTKKAMVQ